MNDIERLIARLPRPNPSASLDARVGVILCGPARPARWRIAGRQIVALVGTAACAGFAGFVIGRNSQVAIAGEHVAESRALEPMTVSDAHAEVAAAILPPFNREALARFVMPSKAHLPLFGMQPLDVAVPHPLEQQ